MHKMKQRKEWSYNIIRKENTNVATRERWGSEGEEEREKHNKRRQGKINSYKII